MKHQIYLIIAAAIVLSGCISSKIEEELKQREQELAEYNVDFTYQVIKDGKVKFTNTSDSRLTAKDFMWIFGEEAFAEKTYECTYTFKHSGTHTVTLQAKLPSGQKKSVSRDVTVTIPGSSDPDPGTDPQPQNPTKIYIYGIEYVAVDVQLDYYYAKMIDDDFFTTTWFYTAYTDFLYDNILPYTYTFKAPKLMDGLDEDDYYTLFIYHSVTGEDDGTQCLKQNIMTSQFKQALTNQSKYIQVSNNSGKTIVRLLLKYE